MRKGVSMRKGMEMAMWRWRSRRRGFVFRVLVLFINTCLLEMNFFLEQWSENRKASEKNRRKAEVMSGAKGELGGTEVNGM